MSFVILYVTHENEKEAEKIVSRLLDKKMIACSNMYHMKAQYLWKGKIEKTGEVVTILKTRKSLWKKVKEEIEAIHPYDVPCIIKLEAQANKPYEEWVDDSTKD